MDSTTVSYPKVAFILYTVPEQLSALHIIPKLLRYCLGVKFNINHVLN